jgi:uroporphyrinogen decarboxylase
MQVSPSVYEHAATFINRSPWEVSRSAELIYEAHAAAYEHYRHTPIMPGIDIYNLEPEAYGARIDEPIGNNIPAVDQHPLSSTAELMKLPPLDPHHAGRIPLLLDAAQRLAARFPEADIRVPVSGPFSIACNLVGFDALLWEAATEPEQVAGAMMHLVEGQVRFAEAIREAGVDVAFFESADALSAALSADRIAGAQADHGSHRRGRGSSRAVHHRRQHRADRRRHARNRHRLPHRAV